MKMTIREYVQKNGISIDICVKVLFNYLNKAIRLKDENDITNLSKMLLIDGVTIDENGNIEFNEMERSMEGDDLFFNSLCIRYFLLELIRVSPDENYTEEKFFYLMYRVCGDPKFKIDDIYYYYQNYLEHNGHYSNNDFAVNTYRRKDYHFYSRLNNKYFFVYKICEILEKYNLLNNDFINMIKLNDNYIDIIELLKESLFDKEMGLKILKYIDDNIHQLEDSEIYYFDKYRELFNLYNFNIVIKETPYYKYETEEGLIKKEEFTNIFSKSFNNEIVEKTEEEKYLNNYFRIDKVFILKDIFNKTLDFSGDFNKYKVELDKYDYLNDKYVFEYQKKIDKDLELHSLKENLYNEAFQIHDKKRKLAFKNSKRLQLQKNSKYVLEIRNTKQAVLRAFSNYFMNNEIKDYDENETFEKNFDKLFENLENIDYLINLLKDNIKTDEERDAYSKLKSLRIEREKYDKLIEKYEKEKELVKWECPKKDRDSGR